MDVRELSKGSIVLSRVLRFRVLNFSGALALGIVRAEGYELELRVWESRFLLARRP